MIKAIFFDFDGVLTLNERGSTVTIQAIHELNPDIPLAKIQDCYYRYHGKLLVGECDHSGIWDDFCAAVGKRIDPSVLAEAFARTPMNQEMMDLASRLAVDRRVGIITDNAADRMGFLIAKHRLDRLFDPIVISGEARMRKDSAALFEYVLKKVDFRPEECAFIDNQERNLVAPAGLGFRTLFFDPAQNDAQWLRGRLTEWGVDA